MAAAFSTSVAARDLTVVSWGGAYQDGQKEVFFKPFNAAGTKLLDESWDGGLGVLRTKIKGGNNNWDVVQVESDELLIGCEEGLYEKLDWAKLGGKDKYLADAVNDCGVGAIVYSFVLAYDGERTTPVDRNTAITVSDLDNATLASATVTIVVTPNARLAMSAPRMASTTPSSSSSLFQGLVKYR